jgi:hypothetical protein
VPLKSTGYCNTGIGPDEVEEDPMMTMRAQRITTQEFFFTVVLFLKGGTDEVAKKQTKTFFLRSELSRLR